MLKKTSFTTITPLPPGISRETVMESFHDHDEMIDLNPSHEKRHQIKPPPEATPEEYYCTWYQIVDRVSYLPIYSGEVSFKACFHDLTNGLQTHCYAPMGLEIKTKWTLGGNLPEEPVQPVELGIGAPISGLYIREDVDIKCNFLIIRLVRKTLKQSLAALVARLLVKSQLLEASAKNRLLTYDPNSLQQFSSSNSPSVWPPPMSPLLSPLHTGDFNMEYPRDWSQAMHSPLLYQGSREDPNSHQLCIQQQEQLLRRHLGALHEMDDSQKAAGQQGDAPAVEVPDSMEWQDFFDRALWN